LYNTNALTGLLYKSNLNSGSVLEYALAFTSAALDRHYSKWSATPKTGFIDITTSKDFYRIFSGLQYVSNSIRFYLLCLFSYVLCPIKNLLLEFHVHCYSFEYKLIGWHDENMLFELFSLTSRIGQYFLTETKQLGSWLLVGEFFWETEYFLFTHCLLPLCFFSSI
jgi:hypothetical protein